MIHIPAGQSRAAHHDTQNDAWFKTCELSISGIFCLIFLDRGCLWVTETVERETADKGDPCASPHVARLVLFIKSRPFYIRPEVFGRAPISVPRICHLPQRSASSWIASPWSLVLNSVWFYFHLAAVPCTSLLWASESPLLALSSPNQDQNVLLKHATGLPSNSILHFAFCI